MKNRYLVLLAIGTSTLAMAGDEFTHETVNRSHGVIRPTVLCRDSSEKLNEALKVLQEGSYKLSALSTNMTVGFGSLSGVHDRVNQICVIVEPQK